MTNGHLTPILRHIRALVGEETAHDTDAELLERFSACHEERAFAALVQRYGPLVLGVCRRVLCHTQDAEDAFQATFLILAHKAGSVRKRESVASFLYGVAYRVAVKARADAARRRQRDRRAVLAPSVDPSAELMGRELAQAILEELDLLPERYRAPLVLCCLSDKTQEQAARELGWPVSSLSRWLARGKEMLRRRLARRGLTISTTLLGTALAELSAEAAPAMTLTATTIQAALVSAARTISSRVADLVEGGLQTMGLMKFTLGKCLLLLAGLVAAGGGVLALQNTGEPGQANVPGGGPAGVVAQAPGGGDATQQEAEPAAESKNKPKTDIVKAEVTILMDGNGRRQEPPVEITLTDPRWVKMLASYFPTMGLGRKGDPSGAWKPGILIRFHPAKGEPRKVSVHWEGDVWSEGNGDWDVSANVNYYSGFLGFLDDIVKSTVLKALEGTWKVVSVEDNGQRWLKENLKDLRWIIREDRITFWRSDRRFVRRIELHSHQPQAFDLYLDAKEVEVFPGGPATGGGTSPARGKFGGGGAPGMGGMRPGGGMPGMGMAPPGGIGGVFYPAIYSQKGDELRICEGRGKRPTDFTAGKDSNRLLYTLRQEKEAASRSAGGAPRSNERLGEWSKSVNHLSGRLLVAFEKLPEGGLRHAVTLELRNAAENASTEPVAVTNQPKLEVALLDGAGNLVEETSFPMSGPIPGPQWGLIPRDGYLGVRVDMRTVGVPIKDQVLLAVGGKNWGLKPGKYVLRARLVAEKVNGPDNQWTGAMDLPPVPIGITQEQVMEPGQQSEGKR